MAMVRLLPGLLLAASLLAGGGSAAAAAQSQPLALTREQCRNLVQYVPAPDVAYRPGVDVNGKPVAPADLPQTMPAPAPDEIVIDLKRPLAQVAPGRAPPAIASSNAHFGLVTIDPASGKVYLDGKPLEDPEMSEIASACRRAGVR